MRITTMLCDLCGHEIKHNVSFINVHASIQNFTNCALSHDKKDIAENEICDRCADRLFRIIELEVDKIREENKK